MHLSCLDPSKNGPELSEAYHADRSRVMRDFEIAAERFMTAPTVRIARKAQEELRRIEETLICLVSMRSKAQQWAAEIVKDSPEGEVAEIQKPGSATTRS
jgi:hypothetical protein